MKQFFSRQGGGPIAWLHWLAVGFVFCALAANNACREDYFFATQVQIASSASSTSGSSTSESDESTSRTSASQSSRNSSSFESSSMSSSAALAAATGPSPAVSAAPLLPLLAELSEKPIAFATKVPEAQGAAAARGVAAAGEASNWLGNLGNSDSMNGQAANRQVRDSDLDGFSDDLENRMGSNARDPRSVPNVTTTTSWRDRLRGVDDDADGATNDEERSVGTDPDDRDSDNDRSSDGAEVLAGTNPLDAQSKPYDSDADGLSDEYEDQIGTNAFAADTDNDALSDDREIAFGSNPFSNDSDKDGILDGKEVQMGPDPQTPDF